MAVPSGIGDVFACIELVLRYQQFIIAKRLKQRRRLSVELGCSTNLARYYAAARARRGAASEADRSNSHVFGGKVLMQRNRVPFVAAGSTPQLRDLGARGRDEFVVGVRVAP